MKIGYARVSTRTQAKDGNSLESQKRLLQENGAELLYIDTFTGAKLERPEFKKMLARLSSGDTLLVTKLDRFARSLSQGSQLVTRLIEQGVKVHILNIGLMDNSPANTLIRNIFFSFAEFERQMIVERTTEGKEIAKLKEGFKEGRPLKYSSAKITAALALLETSSYKEVETLTGISRSTLYRAKMANINSNF